MLNIHKQVISSIISVQWCKIKIQVRSDTVFFAGGTSVTRLIFSILRDKTLIARLLSITIEYKQLDTRDKYGRYKYSS